jgi:putative membrane protein
VIAPRAGPIRSRLRRDGAMSERQFYEERAKREARAAVEAVEAETSAEIVVCLRGASDVYRDADYLVGFLVSLAALVTMLFVDRPFALGAFPLGVVAGFLAGTAAAANVAQIRRLLLFPRRQRAAVGLAARAAFHDQGVSRTHGRTGILLYVSMFERRVEVLPDVGILAAGVGPEWTAAVAALESSLRPSPDLDRFLAAVRALGPILGRRLPRAADDVNELPDDVQ